METNPSEVTLLLSAMEDIDKEHEMTKTSRCYIAELWCKMLHASPMWPAYLETRLAQIFVARHCTTAWNIEGRLQGTIDLPLAEVGMKEARDNIAFLRSLGIDRIVCSTARRAYETAQIYGDALAVTIHGTPRLRELCSGSASSRTGAAAFEQKRPANHSAEQERIAYLEKKIQTKDEVLAELMAAR